MSNVDSGRFSQPPSGGGGGVSGLATADGGTALADNKVVRGDGTTGIQGSAVDISDAGAVTVPNGSAAAPTVALAGDGSNRVGFFADTSGRVFFALGGVVRKVQDGNSLSLVSAGILRWSSGADPTTGIDLSLFRTGISEATFGNAAGGISSVRASRPVEASTAGAGAPNLLLASESRVLITNEGATAEAYNALPSAAATLEFPFYCQDADGIRVIAAAGDTIRLGGAASAAAGFVRSVVVGSALILTCINATEWVATSIVGTWTVDV